MVLFAYMFTLNPFSTCMLLFPSRDKMYLSIFQIWAFPVIFLYQQNAVEVTLHNFQDKGISVFILGVEPPCTETQTRALNDLVQSCAHGKRSFHMETPSHFDHCS